MTFLILLSVFCIGFSQDSLQKFSDSIKNRHYSYFLEKAIEKFQDGNRETALESMKQFVKGAKKERDSSNVIEGYYYLYFLSDDINLALPYADSGLSLSKKSDYTDFNKFLYMAKAEGNHILGNYSVALDSYLEAQKIAENQKDSQTLIELEFSIGSLKLRAGGLEEAIKHFRKYHRSLPKEDKQGFSAESHLMSLYGLGYAYQQNSQLDSATYYNTLTLKQAKKYSDIYHLHKAKINEAIIFYHSKKYEQTIDSILKYYPKIEKEKDSIGISLAYLYLGKAFTKLNEVENAIYYLKKADTIAQKKKIFIRELRENYTLLRSHFKEKGNLQQYLIYLEKLINYDSILNKKNNHLKNNIITKYENPKLFKEKEVLIRKLEDSSNKKSLALYTTLVLIIGLLILLTFNYQKRLKYKKRFELLTTENTTDLSPVILKKSKNHHKKEALTIPENVIIDVLKKLEAFENEVKFLDSKVTLISLAKSLDTNSNYLSKIINHYKEKNFSSYISDLRITYVIQALKEQPKLKEYTIKAIAFEVGFNNVESFTKAFYKKTQLYPSYFIKQLKKRESKHEHN